MALVQVETLLECLDELVVRLVVEEKGLLGVDLGIEFLTGGS